MLLVEVLDFVVAVLAFVALVVFLLVVVFFVEEALDLLVVDWPGSARQCALVLLPFLLTEDLRQVQLLFAEQAEELNPEHWLAACAGEMSETAARKIVAAIEICLIIVFLTLEFS